MFDTVVYFLSRVFSFASSFYFERESKHIKEKTRKCVKDYHQSSSFVAESMMFFFSFSLSVVVVSDAIELLLPSWSLHPLKIVYSRPNTAMLMFE